MATKKKKRNVILVTALIVAFIFVQTYWGVVPFLPSTLSVISFDKVVIDANGNAEWQWTASINKPNELFSFVTTPSKYTYLSDEGTTTITPKGSLNLVVNAGDKQCIYQSTKQTKYLSVTGTILDFLISKTGFNRVEYYTLNNPKKQVNVEIAEGKYNSVQNINGAIVDSIPIKNNYGETVIRIESQGLLGGEYSCPNYDNLAIQKTKDGYIYRYKNEIDAWINNPSTTTYFNLRYNTAFTESFYEYPSFDGNQLMGIINFGNPVITIRADADYFDSTYYTEPKQAEPNIYSIDTPNEIKSGDSSSGRVIIKNNGDLGLVNLKITSYEFYISGYSSNFNLDDLKTIVFDIKAPNKAVSGNINFEVCSVSQGVSSGDKNCDSDSVRIKSIVETPKEYCGDRVCQSFESYSDCPSDCKVGKEICGNGIDDDLDGLIDSEDEDCFVSIKCQSCDDKVISTMIGWAWKEKKCEPTLLQGFFGCWTSWIKFILSFIALIFGTLFSRDILGAFKQLRKSKAGNVIAWILAIGIGIGLMVLTFQLFWVGVIVFILYFIGKTIIKFTPLGNFVK